MNKYEEYVETVARTFLSGNDGKDKRLYMQDAIESCTPFDAGTGAARAIEVLVWKYLRNLFKVNLGLRKKV